VLSVSSVVELLFSVRDTGIGIAADKIGRVFEAFAQGDSSTTRQYGGTGLGLAICSKLVALMGGRLQVESQPGHGSTFHFTATFALSGRADDRRVPAAPAQLRDLPVLIVDDNATNRRILTEIVSAWQMKPLAVPSGRAALVELKHALVGGEPFPLVLVDTVMPEMDGFALAREIKRQPDLEQATLLMLSSADQQRDALRCRQLGIAHYLVKPVKPSELLTAMLAALGASRIEDRGSRIEEGTRRSSRPLRILLAEDNPVNQTLAILLLGKQGHTVVVVGDGKQAVAALEKDSFDVVLMDVQMPEMDGFAATAVIRAGERKTGQHIPIIAVTAYAMKGDRERCLQAGMDGYLAKPIDPDELVAALARVTASGRQGETVAAVAASEPPRLDRAAILQRAGGKEDNLRQLVEIFADESAQLLARIRDSIANKQAPRLRQAAHSLKGAIAVFGADAAVAAAQTLEDIGQEANLEGAEEAATVLARELDQMRHALEEMVAEDAGKEENPVGRLS
jgi:CheY-like chemotaxis protein/HPt (histidine-containing phosphotransfer) domain-containing protein